MKSTWKPPNRSLCEPRSSLFIGIALIKPYLEPFLIALFDTKFKFKACNRKRFLKRFA